MKVPHKPSPRIAGQRKRAADKPRTDDERLRTAFADAAIGMALATIDGSIIQVNPAYCAISERRERELIGSTFFSIAHPDDLDQNLRYFRELISGQISRYVIEQRYLTKRGREVWVQNSVSVSRDGKGNATGVIVLAEDITERKRVRELEREQHGLKESVAAMERVLGVVAHELRTPLASVRAMSEMLVADGCQGPHAQEFAQRLHDEAVRMSRIVDDILEAARLNSGRARWNWSGFALDPVCRLALDSIRPLVSEEIELTCSVDPAAQVRADADALRRLMINLLSNAQKHTTRGRIHLGVRCYSDAAGRWVEISVTDSGDGIDPAVLPRLGCPFELNSGVVGAGPTSGTGLGLAICHGIAEAHGGRIAFSSAPGRGTTVTALLRADLSGPLARQRQGILPLTAPSSPATPAAA